MRIVLYFILLLCSSMAWAQASRVVSLAPSLTEVMLDLHAEQLLVGILDGGERPAAVQAIPSIGNNGQINVEQLLSLHPDLILYWPGSISVQQKQALEQLGLPIFDASTDDLDSFSQLFTRLGAALGKAEQGRQLTAEVEQRLKHMSTQYQRTPRLKVFYQVWDRPMFTLGGSQIMSEILNVCGADNIFADIKSSAPQVDIEAVMLRQPDVILTSSENLLAGWQRWQSMYAVQQKQLLTIQDKGLERPSLQMLNAMQHLCDQLKPMHSAN